MRPYLKAEMVYGLRVLLYIVQNANSGQLSKKEAGKKLGDVKYAGDLMGNHLFAVTVLRGLIVNRQLLKEPVVALTLCNAVRKKLFHGDKEMSNDRIRTAVGRASDNLGFSLLIGEHALCESIRGEKAGNDAFHKDQDFLWISEGKGSDGMITEIRRGRRAIYRTEESDRRDYDSLDHDDSTMIKHRWWLPKPDRTDCLVHFVKECISTGSDPMEVLYSSKKGKESASEEEKIMLWKKYVTKASNKIDTSKLPIELRSIHLVQASKASKKKGTSKASRQIDATKLPIELRSIHKKASKAELARTPVAHKESGEGTSNVVTNVEKDHGRKRKARSSANDNMHGTIEGTIVKLIDLETMAKTLWREHYGVSMPNIKPFGDSYKSIGTVWTMSVDQEQPVYTTTEYPPSILDECMISLPDEGEEESTVVEQQRFAFKTQFHAKMALYWWIICTIPTVPSRIKWAKEILGEHTSAVLYTTRSPMWTILSKGHEGSITVEYNGRKCDLV
jgi:hypothetical protein